MIFGRGEVEVSLSICIIWLTKLLTLQFTTWGLSSYGTQAAILDVFVAKRQTNKRFHYKIYSPSRCCFSQQVCLERSWNKRKIYNTIDMKNALRDKKSGRSLYSQLTNSKQPNTTTRFRFLFFADMPHFRFPYHLAQSKLLP